MTKNILYICLAELLAYSCEQKESFIFAETDGLYFALPDSKEQPWTSAEPETLNHKLDFPFKETGERDTDGYFPYIYGDTPRTDSIRLFIAVAGNSSDQPREYHLKAETVNDSTEMADIVLPEVCILAPHAVKDTVVVYINSPRKIGEFAAAIIFDKEKSPAFPGNITGWDKYEIQALNRYPKPEAWEDEKYGEYSEEKYAFMVKVLRTSYQYFSWIPGSNWAYDGGVTDLINALNAYNAEHPDAPKDFTFPGM